MREINIMKIYYSSSFKSLPLNLLCTFHNFGVSDSLAMLLRILD